MESIKKAIDTVKKQLDDLDKLNNPFRRAFTSRQSRNRISKELAKSKTPSGKKLDKADPIQLKRRLTAHMQYLKRQLNEATQTVEQIKGKVYSAYTGDSTFKGAFSRDHHITDKLNGMIKEETRLARIWDRKHPSTPDQRNFSPAPTRGREDRSSSPIEKDEKKSSLPDKSTVSSQGYDKHA
jgi:hypothetical protein